MATTATKATKARANYKRVVKKSKPGSGSRFKALVKSVKAEGKSEASAEAIAASAGRKKYTGKKMSEMAQRGKARKARSRAKNNNPY